MKSSSCEWLLVRYLVPAISSYSFSFLVQEEGLSWTQADGGVPEQAFFTLSPVICFSFDTRVRTLYVPMALPLPAQQQPFLDYCQVGLSFLEQGMNSVATRDSTAIFFVV